MSTVETRETVGTPMPHEHREEEHAHFFGGGSFTQSLAAIAAIVLAIVGLAGLYEPYVTPIAGIVLGAALMMKGAACACRASEMLSERTALHHRAAEANEGMNAEFFGGAAGIVLGILALVNVVPTVLLPVTAITYGAALILAMGARWSMSRAFADRPFEGAHFGASTASVGGAQLMVGLAAIVLGIIALIGIHTWVLTLAAFLVVGSAVLVSGAALGGRMMSAFSR